MGCILFTIGKRLEDHHILEAEILAIREAIVAIIQKQLSDVIIESGSLIAVQAIRREINSPSNIRILVEDVNILTKVIKNIKFVYRSRLANQLADIIAKKAHPCCT